jgi:hypothetical protein
VIEIKGSIRALARDRDVANTIWEQPLTLPDYPNDYQTEGANEFYTEQEIDISGLTTVMEKALLVVNVDVAQSDAYAAGTGLTSSNPFSPETTGYEWLVVTDVPWDVDGWISGLPSNLLQYRVPGVFSDMQNATIKTISTDNILYGRFRLLQNSQHTPSNVALVKGESFFGDAQMTMSDTLYLYRVFLFVGATTAFDQIRAPELEFRIQGHKGELTDLEQIMELRRSYLLQQTIS